jgi:sulfite exporter TauE/SafE
MSEETGIVAAFLIGLLGSTHCIGMCGGIVGACVLSLPQQVRGSALHLAAYLGAYNAGRLASYTLAGGVVGFLGGQATGLLSVELARRVGITVSAGFLILLGLYLANWWRALGVFERAGARLWRFIEPAGRRFFPVRSLARALGVGLVWGWLPCGLVYTALVLALTSGSAVEGAIVMAAFGIGTLPMLFALGASGRWLLDLTRRAPVRQLAGTLIIAFGLYAMLGGGPHPHAQSTTQHHGT